MLFTLLAPDFFHDIVHLDSLLAFALNFLAIALTGMVVVSSPNCTGDCAAIINLNPCSTLSSTYAYPLLSSLTPCQLGLHIIGAGLMPAAGQGCGHKAAVHRVCSQGACRGETGRVGGLQGLAGGG